MGLEQRQKLEEAQRQIKAAHGADTGSRLKLLDAGLGTVGIVELVDDEGNQRRHGMPVGKPEEILPVGHVGQQFLHPFHGFRSDRDAPAS